MIFYVSIIRIRKIHFGARGSIKFPLSLITEPRMNRLMKQGLNYALFGTVVAIAAGLISAYGLPDFSENESGFAAAQMLGHVTMIHTDAEGNILSYQQSDNIIVDRGESCVLKQVFGIASDSDITPSDGLTDKCGSGITTNPGVFEHIAIGNGTGSAAAGDIALNSEHNVTGGTNGLERTDAGSTTKAYSTQATSARVVLSAQFTNSYAAGLSYDVTESGIFNSTETPTGATVDPDTMLFAHQTFTPITLDNGESLTVEWTVDIGGTGNALGTGEQT